MNALIKRPITKLLIFVLIATLALAACAQSRSTDQESGRDLNKEYNVAPVAPQPEAPAEAAPAAPGYSSGGASDDAGNQKQGGERLVIKNGSLTLVVPDPAKSMANVSAMAEKLGGFVVSANMYKEFVNNGAEVPRASVTIRVPSERMNEAMDRIKAESKEEPQNENVSSQDVTSEYVDLQSRLKNLEAAETELTRIMQEAKRTEDVLAVYQQLVTIREQIEVIKGQIKYYEQSAALSAITVELIADAAVQPIEIAGWQPQGVAKNAVEALVRTMQGLANVAIWLVVYLLPILVVLFVIFGLPLILLVRYLRRRSRSQKAVVVAPPAE